MNTGWAGHGYTHDTHLAIAYTDTWEEQSSVGKVPKINFQIYIFLLVILPVIRPELIYVLEMFIG